MEHKEHLQDLMADIINIFGKEIITEKRFVNLLADYRAFDGNNDARRILNAIVSGRYAHLIVNLTTSQLDLPHLKYYAHELSMSDGFNEETVETVMRMIVFACNRDEEFTTNYHIEKKDEKYGCIDSNGGILIPFEYDKIIEFKSDFGVHLVCQERFVKGDIYTSAGELVFSGHDHFYFTNKREVWLVEKDGKKGAIHPNGEIVVPLIYKQILTVNPGGKSNLLVVETTNGFGIVDYKGNQIVPPIFESICNHYDDTFEIIEAKLRDRYMYFNVDGTVAEITPLFCTTPFTAESYNLNDHKLPKGYIVDGKKLVVSTTEKDITDLGGKILCHLGKYNDGLAVAKDSHWIGYMDASLKFKIRQFRNGFDSSFDWCDSFDNGVAIVLKGNKYGLIDTNGDFLYNTYLDEIERRDWCVLLRHSVSYMNTCFGNNYKIGECYVRPYDRDCKFRCRISGIHDIGNFTNGRALARYKNFVGIVTSEGKTIEPLEYEWLRPWNSLKLHEAESLSPVRRNGVWGKLDLTNGFVPFNDAIQEKNERTYISKLIAAGKPIPYAIEYQKDEYPCGYNWRNVYHIANDLYPDFISQAKSMTTEERIDWVKTNGVILNSRK